MSNLAMSCYFCGCVISDAKNFSVDSDSNVIVACDECYDKVNEFCKGGKNRGKSGLRDKRPE